MILSLLKNIFPFIKFFDNFKQNSFLKKILITIENIVFVYFILFFVFAFRPDLFANTFKNNINSKYFNLYYNDNISNEKLLKIKNTLNKLDKIISQEPMFYKEFKDYVYHFNRPYYVLSNPLEAVTYMSYREFSLGNTLKERVVISYLYNQRQNSAYTLLGLLHHEAIHTLMYHKYGFLHPQLHHTWIIEGYPVYRTLKQGSVNYSKKFYHEALTTQYDNLDIKHKYLIWGLMVEYAIEELGYSLDDLMSKSINFDQILSFVYKKYNNLY